MAKPLVNHAIARIAARLEPTLARAFERAVRQLQAQIGIEAVERALAHGEVTPEILAGLANFPKQLEPVGRVIQQTYVQAGESAANHLARHLGVRAAFNVANPRAATWAATQAGKLITEVSQTTRQGVREVIARAFSDGLPPRESAKLIRNLVGLTEQQGQAVVNYRFTLLEAGRTADDVARLAERYAAKLHRQRALTIARTETITASGAGQQEAWNQAVADGYLDEDATVREWIAAEDERTCPVCGQELDGKTAGLNEPFECSLGPILHQPAHPACRCSVGIIAA